MSRLLVPFADQHVEIPSMTAGNIALTVGLKQVLHHTFIRFLVSIWKNFYAQFISHTLIKDGHRGHHRFIEVFSSSRSPQSPK